MSIATKYGDHGLTCLSFGPKVMKDHARIEANGAVDELCSYLGIARSLVKIKATKIMIESVQRDLFTICAEIAAGPAASRLKTRIGIYDVNRLNAMVEEIEKLKVCKYGPGFYLPGQDFISSVLDISRSVARRAERRVVTLKKRKMLKNAHITAYLNRLSDLLYLLVRRHEKSHCKL
jgi:cob(I)alamin adenosyltransferase